MARLTLVCAVALVAVLAAGTTVVADPTAGEVIKWSQPPVEIQPGLIYGWDEWSMWGGGGGGWPIVADDFMCTDPRPVTDLHWWGSYPDAEPGTTPQPPAGFLIRFWKDVPAGADPNPDITWSHPGEPIHEIWCFNYREQPFGQDIDVGLYDETGQIEIMDECYQYNQDLVPEEYFWQTEGEIYWLSIQALYEEPIEFEWGWKTRPHYFNDDAVWGVQVDGMDIIWDPIMDFPPDMPDGRSWDMAYELSVPEPVSLSLLGIGLLAVFAKKRRRTLS